MDIGLGSRLLLCFLFCLLLLLLWLSCSSSRLLASPRRSRFLRFYLLRRDCDALAAMEMLALWMSRMFEGFVFVLFECLSRMWSGALGHM